MVLPKEKRSRFCFRWQKTTVVPRHTVLGPRSLRRRNHMPPTPKPERVISRFNGRAQATAPSLPQRRRWVPHSLRRMRRRPHCLRMFLPDQFMYSPHQNGPSQCRFRATIWIDWLSSPEAFPPYLGRFVGRRACFLRACFRAAVALHERSR